MLDPIADKLLVAAVLLMLVADQTIVGWSLWAAIVILCREILVSGLREYLAELRVSVPVSTVAKWKTTAQFVALGFLIAGPAGDGGGAGFGDDRRGPAVDRGDPDALHRLGLYEGELRSCRRRVSVDESGLFRLGARAHRQGRGGDLAARRVATVGELIAWLSRRGEEYAYAFEKAAIIRAALDRTHVRHDAPIARRARDRILSADDRRMSGMRRMATIRVQAEEFDAAAEAAALTRGRADIGAVVTFIGLCRDEGGALRASKSNITREWRSRKLRASRMRPRRAGRCSA